MIPASEIRELQETIEISGVRGDYWLHSEAIVKEDELFLFGVIANQYDEIELMVAKFKLDGLTNTYEKDFNDHRIFIYPNPIHAGTQFSITGNFIGIYDFVGRLISEEAIAPNSPGIYVVIPSHGSEKLVVTY